MPYVSLLCAYYIISSRLLNIQLQINIGMLTLTQIKSLCAGFICIVIYGSSYTYGTIVPYATSFIYHKGNRDIASSQMALLLPVSIVILNLGMPLANIKKAQFSNRITALISVTGISVCVFTMSFGTQFWNYVVVYGIIFGAFMGYGYMAPIKNCYEHIPNQKGLCSGVCILGMGISSLVFNQILLAIINPENQHPQELQDHRKIYSQAVAYNLPTALKIMSGVYITLGLIGVALMTPPTKENDTNVQKINEKAQLTEDQLKISLISQTENEGQQSKVNPYTFAYLTSKRIHLQLLTLLFSVPFGIFIAFNYKEYGFTRIEDDAFLTTVGSTGAVFNGLGRLFFGIMFDKFSFKLVSSAINMGLLVFAIVIPYLLQVRWMFLVGIAAIYFCYGGNYAVYPTHTARIFGAEVGGKVYFIPFIGFTIGSIIQWLFRLVFVTQANKYQDFKMCFYIFGGFNLISLILSLKINYDYVDAKTTTKEISNEKHDQE